MTVQSITVPLYIEHDRPYIDLDILGSEGRSYQARFLVDTGGGSFLLPEAVAHKVGMLLTGKDLIRESGSYLKRISPPRVFVGGMPLDLAQTDAFVVLKVTGLSLPQVVAALRGEPGHMHMLLLERDGALLAVNVPTARIL